MRSWIGVHLPLLSLEAVRPRWSEPGKHVIVDRLQVVALSAEAAVDGVRIGMQRSGALMMSPDAVLHEQDTAQEQATLESIALAMLRFTPEVALADEHSLLLDVTASLRAFGGRLALCRLVRAAVLALGFTAELAMAPTAQGAWLLARQCTRRALRRCVSIPTMVRRLDRLPCSLLPQVRPYLHLLTGLGCKTLGELRLLPRAGLQRRTSGEVLAFLDRAYGRAPELFNWVQAPQSFSARLELPDRIEHAEAVLFAARRLLLQMTGWLSARQLAVPRFILRLEHERGRTAIAPTTIDIALAEPAWQDEHLTRLLKERLGRIVLERHVIALRLEVPETCALKVPNGQLFPEAGGSVADYKRLLELLIARLGECNVLVPAPQADYRPEMSNAWMPPAHAVIRSLERMQHAKRPFWLFEQPVALTLRGHYPFHGSELKLVEGPERIECGWWDDQLQVRDYYIAQDSAGCHYWLYRIRFDESGYWFLHGLFA
jgi:protein ImuB